MRHPAFVCAFAALGATLASPASAQVVRGRLVDTASHAPVSSALAELRDLQGKLVQQAFTSPSGAFVLMGAPGQRYQLRFAAIGYAKHPVMYVTAGADPVVVPDIALAAVVVSLPDLRAMGGKKACGKSELTPETFGGLFESAHTSLQLMDATLRSAQLGFEVQLIHTLMVRTAKDSSRSADTSSASLHSWPVVSLSLDSLQALGFLRLGTAQEGAGTFYYGPDLQVLFSDWFLDNHCFTLDKGRSKGDTVVIQFDPAGKQKHVDIGGDLVLDRATLTLRRLTYTHRNLPDGFPDHISGGEMRFAEKSEGLWVPVEWAIWAPILQPVRQISRPPMIVMAPGQRGMGRTMTVPQPPPQAQVQIVGRDESRGRLTRIVALGGS